MSLRGPLHGQKQYLTAMLETHNITLQAVRFAETIGKKTTIYRFIYDTRMVFKKIIDSDGKEKREDIRPYTEKCQQKFLEDLLEEHFEGYDITVELPPRIHHAPKVSWRWRVMARVLFTKKTKAKAKKP